MAGDIYTKVFTYSKKLTTKSGRRDQTIEERRGRESETGREGRWKARGVHEAVLQSRRVLALRRVLCKKMF